MWTRLAWMLLPTNLKADWFSAKKLFLCWVEKNLAAKVDDDISKRRHFDLATLQTTATTNWRQLIDVICRHRFYLERKNGAVWQVVVVLVLNVLMKKIVKATLDGAKSATSNFLNREKNFWNQTIRSSKMKTGERCLSDSITKYSLTDILR